MFTTTSTDEDEDREGSWTLDWLVCGPSIPGELRPACLLWFALGILQSNH